MEIRKTTANDIDAIMDVFASAKCYMKANGNASQWDDNYPGRDTLDNDIANGNSYVFIDNGEVIGTFAFICGEDETYRVIENGAWRSDAPYGTVHRLASTGAKSRVHRRGIPWLLPRKEPRDRTSTQSLP